MTTAGASAGLPETVVEIERHVIADDLDEQMRRVSRAA